MATSAGDGAAQVVLGSSKRKFVLGPGKSQDVSVPVREAKAMFDAYTLSADATDAIDYIAPTSNGPNLNISFTSLTPSSPSATIAGNGSSTLTFTLTDDGNLSCHGTAKLVFYSEYGFDAPLKVTSQSQQVTVPVGQSKLITVHLNKKQTTLLADYEAPAVVVIDPFGRQQVLYLHPAF